jgi:hypothetical protein
LKQLTNHSEIVLYTDYSGEFTAWLVNVTGSQLDQIEKRDDVSAVEENSIDYEEAAVVPVPTEPARLSEAMKAKRDIL